ncbi:hypothetical protein [Pseudomonas helvetica]|uniref:hypothetical protein n=1 Tax=Pseudomonas helvetica TaxID=3136738 RepID=UPI003267F5CF
MHPTVETALTIISSERDESEYSDSFEAVRAVVVALGEEDLAERLFLDIPGSVPFELIADLFDLLAWQTDDNGAAITRSVENWLLDGRDIRKVRIALNLEVYPFRHANEMYRVLSALGESTPEVAHRCQEMIASRKQVS